MHHTRPWRLTPVVLAAVAFSCQSQTDLFVETYEVERGEFVNSVTISGELEAISSKIVTAPSISWRFGNLKISRIVDDSTQVEEGDFLMQFDAREVEKGVIDAQAELEIAQAELRKALANHKSEDESMEIDLEISRIGHQMAQLNLEQATFKAAIDRQQIQFDLDNAAINLRKAEQELENKKSINREVIRTLELKVEQVQDKLDEANETLAKLTVTAPAPGIAILRKSWYTNSKFKVDDEAYPSQAMIGLPDLSRMQVKVQVNEMDISKIKLEQSVVVTLDAYPDTTFAGHVTEVATLARTKDRESRVKVFDTLAHLDGSDEKLMPGMTISCEIVVERLPDTLFVPLEAVFRKDKETIVYLKDGGDFIERVISAGLENDNYTLVAEGLKEGDHVALTDPTAPLDGETGLPSDPEEKEL